MNHAVSFLSENVFGPARRLVKKYFGRTALYGYCNSMANLP